MQSSFFLKFLSPGIDDNAPNFRLREWPPTAEQPVTLDSDGFVLNRYSDSTWDISHHCNRAYRLHFRDAAHLRVQKVSPENGALFRLCLAWWWWGPHAVSRARELEARFRALRPIFELCTQHRISADRFHRFPKLIALYKAALKPSQAATAVRLLHDVFEARNDLGFILATREQIAELIVEIPTHVKVQTPYVPPRIWQLLAIRTNEIIEEFHEHSDEFSKVFLANVHARISNGAAASTPINEYSGVVRAMRRWLNDHCDGRFPVNTISAYASLVSLCCHVQIVLYSLMRVEEAWCLPLDCFITGKDSTGELVFSVRGDSTKTVLDGDARWIVAESVGSAVSAAQKIARLRLKAGQATGVLGPDADAADAPLFPRSYEPWSTGSGRSLAPFLKIRHAAQELNRELRRYKIFADNELMITDEDFEISRLMNPMINPEIFAVGKRWPLAWHQLRRTGAVNMHASGLVSDASIQYELKHTHAAMSRYYGRGHHLLSGNLNYKTKQDYLRTMYEMLARGFASLRNDTYVSPYGSEHKRRILSMTSAREHTQLLKEAKKGTIAYREHLLGGCTNPLPCDKGGFESVAACGSEGSPCEWLLYDKRRLPRYRELLGDIESRVRNATPGEPLHNALTVQERAVRAAIKICEDQDAA